MSGHGTPGGEGGGDPSMEDILASIRRILSEDEAGDAPAAPHPGPRPAATPPVPPAEPPDVLAPDVLALDASMLVEEPPPGLATQAMPGPEHLPPLHADRPGRRDAEAGATPARPPPPAQHEDSIAMPAPADPPSEPHPAPPAQGPLAYQTPPGQQPGQQPGPLVAPEAAAAAASSVGSLLRTIGTRQGVAVRGGGPTIEDLVREELRPVLKTWLDANLPALVERLVRAEIERVVGRADL